MTETCVPSNNVSLVDNVQDKAFIHRTQDLAMQQGLAIDDVAHDFRALSVSRMLQLPQN